MVKKIVCVLLTAIMVLQTAGCADIRTTVLDKISEETQKDTSKENTSQETTDKADIRYQDDYYEYVNSNLLDKIQLSDTDAQWQMRKWKILSEKLLLLMKLIPREARSRRSGICMNV